MVPDSLTQLVDAREQVEAQRLEKVWQAAQAVMAEEGKPYIPWAAKPEDLPQADILAFPGAEGGGAYTAGGRGGRVFVVNSLADSGPGTLGVDGDESSYLEQIKANEPFPLSAFGRILSAKKAYRYVLDNAGATLPRRDAVDERIVRQVKTGRVFYTEPAEPVQPSPYVKRRLPMDSYKQGIITDIAQVGGYPNYVGTPYLDSDNDGIPDEVELRMGLNPDDPKDAAQISKNGYANIENYLNSVVREKNVRPL